MLVVPKDTPSGDLASEGFLLRRQVILASEGFLFLRIRRQLILASECFLFVRHAATPSRPQRGPAMAAAVAFPLIALPGTVSVRFSACW